MAVQYNWLISELKVSCRNKLSTINIISRHYLKYLAFICYVIWPQEATKPENRQQRPWIIIMGHRPMYCSNSDHDDCTWGFPRVWHCILNFAILFHGLHFVDANNGCKLCPQTRIGIPFLHWFGMEKLLFEYGVDVAIWAHEHSYERLWPIYNKNVNPDPILF